jgi:pimeloyl-ACP methyl ester carboxylesterase
MALSNLTERDWLEDPIVRQASAEECVAIVWLGDGKDTPLNADLNAAGGAALDKLLEDLAQVSGYKELAVAPLIPTGHSANGNFSWDAAVLHPDRVIAAIPIKTYPLPETLRLAGVPMLYMVAETTEWPQYRDFSHPGDRDFFWPVVRDSAIALRSADPNNLIGAVTDPGGGHFDWSDHDARFLALYIRKACHYRLPKPPTDGSRVKLNPIDPHSGWLTDTGGMDPDRFPAAPYDKFLGDPKKAYWFFDEETARAAVAFEGDRKKRARQMLTFVQDGKFLPVASRGYAKLRFDPEPDGITFKLQGTFLSELPPELVHAGEPLGHASGPIQFKRITGPAVQVGPDTFRLQFDRGTLDGNRPKESTIWITEEHPGDGAYRHAVQPGQIVIPTMLTEGVPQQIHFPQIPDQKAGIHSLALLATSTSHVPVSYYVVSGPATVNGDKLEFTEIPIKSAYPIKVTIVAYQWGRITAPLYQSAQPIEQSFLLER